MAPDEIAFAMTLELPDWHGSLNAFISDMQAELENTTDLVHALDAAWAGYMTLLSHMEDVAAEYADDGVTVVGVLRDFHERLTIADRAMVMAHAHRDEFDDDGLVDIIANTLSEKHEVMSDDFVAALVDRQYAGLFLNREGASNSYIEQKRRNRSL